VGFGGWGGLCGVGWLVWEGEGGGGEEEGGGEGYLDCCHFWFF